MKPLRAAPTSLHTSFHFHFNHMKFKTTFLQQQLTAVRVDHVMFSCFLLCLWISLSPSWNMKVGFSLVDSCKLQTHRSGSVCDEAAVCQPLHPKAKQRLHFILSVCVARRSPDGGSASLFFHVGGKSFKSKTSQPISAKHKRLNRSWTKPATSNFLMQSFPTVSWSMRVKSDRTVWISTGETGLTVSLYIPAPKDTRCDLEGPQPLTPCEREKAAFLFQATGRRTHRVFTVALF